MALPNSKRIANPSKDPNNMKNKLKISTINSSSKKNMQMTYIRRQNKSKNNIMSSNKKTFSFKRR